MFGCDCIVCVKLFFSVIVLAIFTLIDIVYIYQSDDPSSMAAGIIFGVGVVLALAIWKVKDNEAIPGLTDPLHVHYTDESYYPVYGPVASLYATSQGTIQHSVKQNNNDQYNRQHECSDHIVV